MFIGLETGTKQATEAYYRLRLSSHGDVLGRLIWSHSPTQLCHDPETALRTFFPPSQTTKPTSFSYNRARVHPILLKWIRLFMLMLLLLISKKTRLSFWSSEGKAFLAVWVEVEEQKASTYSSPFPSLLFWSIQPSECLPKSVIRKAHLLQSSFNLLWLKRARRKK